MAKISQLDRAIATLKAEYDEEQRAIVTKNAILKSVIDTLEAQKTRRPAKKQPATQKGRKLGSVLDEPTS